MKLPKINFKLVAVILALAGLLYYFKSQFVVAWINGYPISRSAYVHELERLAKNQAMDSLITKRLIVAEAAKNKLTVTNEEIEAALISIDNKAKEQGTNLEDLLTAQGVSRDSLKEEIRLQKLLEKLVGEISINDEDVEKYFDDNRKVLYLEKKFDEVKNEIKEQLKQQQLINKIQELIARLQNEAKIVNWLNQPAPKIAD